MTTIWKFKRKIEEIFNWQNQCSLLFIIPLPFVSYIEFIQVNFASSFTIHIHIHWVFFFFSSIERMGRRTKKKVKWWKKNTHPVMLQTKRNKKWFMFNVQCSWTPIAFKAGSRSPFIPLFLVVHFIASYFESNCHAHNFEWMERCFFIQFFSMLLTSKWDYC